MAAFGTAVADCPHYRECVCIQVTRNSCLTRELPILAARLSETPGGYNEPVVIALTSKVNIKQFLNK